MKFELTVLGNNAASPVYDRHHTAQVLNCSKHTYLIDCGEGTQQQMLRFRIDANNIEGIFISHLHGDHYLGVVGLLIACYLNGRTKPLKIFAPEPLKEIIDSQLKHSRTTLQYTLEFHPTNPLHPKVIFADKDLTVKTFALDHRIPCTGFIFCQKQSPDTYRDTSIADQKVPKTYAYCSDTLCSGNYLAFIQEANVLYHESTFTHDSFQLAQNTFHTTALQAAEVACKAKVKKLLIGHFSSHYETLDVLLQEARLVFPETYLAIEGETFAID